MLVTPLRQTILWSVTLFLGAAFFCKTSNAALLVYEGFTGYATSGAFGTPTPSSSTVGLRSNLAYRSTGWTIGSGLTFGALRTSGNAINYTSGNATFLSSQLDLDGNTGNTASFAGTLYSSYLVNISSRPAEGGVQLRVADAFDSNTGNRLFSDADTRQITGSDKPGVAYGTTVSTTSSDLALNTTYLMISRYTNVGTALSAGTPGLATMFILTEAQFANLTLQSNWESYLDNPSTTVGTGAGQIFGRASNSATTGTYLFNDSSYLHFLAVSNGSFDEFRYGDSLASVLPIPEPSRAALILLGSMSLLMRRRRAS